jgi:hypothetical protein
MANPMSDDAAPDASPSPWRVGLARRPITPPEGIPLHGYPNAGQVRRSAGVADALHARAGALEEAEQDFLDAVTRLARNLGHPPAPT